MLNGSDRGGGLERPSIRALYIAMRTRNVTTEDGHDVPPIRGPVGECCGAFEPSTLYKNDAPIYAI